MVRWSRTCADEHMHRRVGSPGEIHDICLYAQGVSVIMYMVIGLGSLEPVHWRTSFSRYVRFPPTMVVQLSARRETWKQHVAVCQMIGYAN